MKDLEEIAGWLRGARKVFVLTGAGVSAESGVPTFRGAGGLWRNHDAMSLATPEAFAADPATVWAWYRWRQALVARLAPNPAHRALVELERRCADGDFLLATQNVDGLHRVAGSRAVVELHGEFFADRCTRCGVVTDAHALALTMIVDPERPEVDPELPACARCRGLTRPGVVWFGEQLPPDALDRAEEAAAAADVTLVVGTSGVVYPAAALSSLTRRAGGRVAVFNLESTPQSGGADATVLGAAGEVLPRLLSMLG